MTAGIADLIWCVVLWAMPLAIIGVTELVRRRRPLLDLLDPRTEERDPSAAMWSAAMRPPRAARR